MKLEKTAFCFKNTNKDFVMLEDDEEDFESNNICRFCEILSDTFRDHVI